MPTDGSACSDEAVAHAAAIAQAMGSALVLLFVMDTLSARREGVVDTAEARQALTAQGRSVLDRGGLTATCGGTRVARELVDGSPAEVIVHLPTEFDLVVMGSHGKGIMKRVTTGSATQGVLHRITRPLLVVRAPVSR